MIRYHIGTEKQLKVKKRLELGIVILFSPIWFPFSIVAVVLDAISDVMEHLLYAADDCVSNFCNWFVRKFVR